MLNNHFDLKYETTYKGPFKITQWQKNGTVTLQYDAIRIRHNIRCIKPYTSDKNIESIIAENYV